METLLRFLRTHCAKLALPDMGSHLQAFFYKLKRKKYEPTAIWSTRYRNEYTKVRRALARLQRTESPDEHPYFSPQEDQSWNWSEKNSEEVMEWDERSDADSNTCSGWNSNSWKTNRGNTWNETTTLRNEDYDEAPPLFPEPVLAWFFLQKSGLEARERNMILAAMGNKYQLDQVEQALKIQFPDNEIRYHDDRNGKHHNTLLGGAVEEEEEQMSAHEETHENSDDDLDALAKVQEEEAEALTSLATANRTLREARDKQHQVRMSRGYFPQQQSQRDRYNKRPERKCVICNGSHWASQCPEKQGKPGEKKGEVTAHTAYNEFSMAVHTETSLL